jgi:exosome complex exonuclease DIS3/RRP44
MIVPTSSENRTDNVVISVFDKVQVNIEVENTQRGRVKMTLVHPVDFSSL